MPITDRRRPGMKQITIWVPDTSQPGFAAECRRQARLVGKLPQEKETLDWLEKIADRRGWK